MDKKIIKTMKNKCHLKFDTYWKYQLRCNENKHMRKVRKRAYHRLAQEMRLANPRDAHFHYMNDTKTLLKAYKVILSWNKQMPIKAMI